MDYTSESKIHDRYQKKFDYMSRLACIGLISGSALGVGGLACGLAVSKFNPYEKESERDPYKKWNDTVSVGALSVSGFGAGLIALVLGGSYLSAVYYCKKRDEEIKSLENKK